MYQLNSRIIFNLLYKCFNYSGYNEYSKSDYKMIIRKINQKNYILIMDFMKEFVGKSLKITVN